jgi:hypothetical protein
MAVHESHTYVWLLHIRMARAIRMRTIRMAASAAHESHTYGTRAIRISRREHFQVLSVCLQCRRAAAVSVSSAWLRTTATHALEEGNVFIKKRGGGKKRKEKNHACRMLACSLARRSAISETLTSVSSCFPPARQHTSAYVGIRQHTSAFVCIHQHTSAYVSIRQHSSTYVGMYCARWSAVCATSSLRPHTLVAEGFIHW